MYRTGKNKTAIYAAMPQWGDSLALEEQVEQCKEHLTKHREFTLTRIYRERGSIEKDGGGAWRCLMDDIECRKIDTVVVTSIRVIGDTFYFAKAYLKRFLFPAGIRFIDVGGGFDSALNDSAVYFNANEQAMRSWILKKAAVNFYDSDRVKRSTVPFGYIYKDEPPYFFVDDRTAPVVKMIFELYTQGYSMTAIAEWLNRNRALTVTKRKEQLYGFKRGKREQWVKDSVKDILKNICYTGDYIKGDSIFTDHHKGIISKELFRKAYLGGGMTKIRYVPDGGEFEEMLRSGNMELGA